MLDMKGVDFEVDLKRPISPWILLILNLQIEEGKAAWAAIKAGFFSGRAGLLEGFKGALRGGISSNNATAASAEFEGGHAPISQQEIDPQAQRSSVRATPPAPVQVSVSFIFCRMINIL